MARYTHKILIIPHLCSWKIEVPINGLIWIYSIVLQKPHLTPFSAIRSLFLPCPIFTSSFDGDFCIVLACVILHAHSSSHLLFGESFLSWTYWAHWCFTLGRLDTFCSLLASRIDSGSFWRDKFFLNNGLQILFFFKKQDA